MSSVGQETKKKYVDVRCPSVVKEILLKHGGVDVLEQMMEYYRSFIRTKKWPLKVIINIFLSLNCKLLV